MASRNANFEIQVMRAGRWAMESVRDTEADARAVAHQLLANKKCEGARIIRNWMRADGMMVENEVFCETRTVTDDAPIRISPIDDAPPPCETPRDYYGTSSRMVMNRLFRQYFEQVFITPTEAIHVYNELKRIQDKDNLVPSAVDRVATLQAKDAGTDPRTRRDDMFRCIDQLSARARRAAEMKLPKLNGSVSELRQKVAGLAEKETEADFLTMVALSRELVGMRNWVAKLDRVCRLANSESDPATLGLLDGLIADILGANVVQELLGWQPGLGQAICRMLDLADGEMPNETSEAGDTAGLLDKLMRERKLPVSRAVLHDRAMRQLRSPNPLYRSDPGKERDTFMMVVERLLTPTGLDLGADAAEALTTRFTRMVEEGGAAGRRAAIAGVFNCLPDRAIGLTYLADLAKSTYAREHMTDIATMAAAAQNIRSLADLCQRGLSMKDRMQRATNAFNALAASPLPDGIRKQVTGHIDGLLERFLVDEKVVERLDNPASPLRDRAMWLVQFCASGVLPKGRAHTLARSRIVALLRQPDFDARFIDGIADAAEAQKSLRDFHLLLTKAGFA